YRKKMLLRMEKPKRPLTVISRVVHARLPVLELLRCIFTKKMNTVTTEVLREKLHTSTTRLRTALWDCLFPHNSAPLSFTTARETESRKPTIHTTIFLSLRLQASYSTMTPVTGLGRQCAAM